METGLGKDSIAMAHLIRAISKDRLEEKTGELKSDNIKNRIKGAIRLYLDLEVTCHTVYVCNVATNGSCRCFLEKAIEFNPDMAFLNEVLEIFDKMGKLWSNDLESIGGGFNIKPGENTQAARLIQFTSVQEIVEMEAILKAYIYEAIEVEKAGLKVDFKKNTELIIPEEFQNKLDEIPALKAAFDALTPGRQRAYILYFSEPKQSKTRESRIEKCMQQILNGKGLNV